jgi:hypothetical protein
VANALGVTVNRQIASQISAQMGVTRNAGRHPNRAAMGMKMSGAITAPKLDPL